MTLHAHQPGRPGRPQWTVRSRSARPALPPLTQRTQIAWLSPQTGTVEEAVRMIPAMPLFERAFSAIVRGGIVPTAEGPVAVEDLLPGDRVVTADGPLPLLWKGTRTVARARLATAFYRIPADALGLGRPLPDLLLGEAARLVTHRASDGRGVALVPVAALADSVSVIPISPISTMQTFHLGFGQHTYFAVNGVDVESHHPGRIDPGMGADALSLYLSLFPHLDDLAGFGPLALPRTAEAEGAA